MSRIAFLGLGRMGSGMALRLLETGHARTVFNRTPSRAEPLARRGAELAASPREAWSAAFRRLCELGYAEQSESQIIEVFRR